jgi:hypothetical protein
MFPSRVQIDEKQCEMEVLASGAYSREASFDFGPAAAAMIVVSRLRSRWCVSVLHTGEGRMPPPNTTDCVQARRTVSSPSGI